MNHQYLPSSFDPSEVMQNFRRMLFVGCFVLFMGHGLPVFGQTELAPSPQEQGTKIKVQREI